MFTTLKSKLLLGVYVFIILSIPVGAYLASESQIFKSRASEGKPKTTLNTQESTASAKTSAVKSLLDSSEDFAASNSQSSIAGEDTSSSPTIATSFGPTMSLKVKLEGRPDDNQVTKLFVGIIEGTLGSNPKFLLSFTINLPKDGSYSNLSLAGLTSGSQYTALLKGSAQIATASAFVMSPTITNLNSGEAINLLSGDLNEDNVINSADLGVAQKALGSTSASENWNDTADLNKDGIVNSFDLSIIKKNIGQVGDSGAWTSPIPTATSSASLQENPSQGGYWIWVPK